MNTKGDFVVIQMSPNIKKNNAFVVKKVVSSDLLVKTRFPIQEVKENEEKEKIKEDIKEEEKDKSEK